MMTMASVALWIIAGCGLALIIFLSQHWTVRVIDPNHIKLSKWLVIGGAFIRWTIISMVIMAAISTSMGALLIVFVTFLLFRLLIIFFWQSQLDSKQINEYN